MNENNPEYHTPPSKPWPPIVDQPPPVPNENTPVWDLVIADMRERDGIGRVRYGTPLQGFNGRDALSDAYQEALDLVVYMRQELHEREVTDMEAKRVLADAVQQVGGPAGGIIERAEAEAYADRLLAAMRHPGVESAP